MGKRGKRNYILLLQGQLVSTLGDALYTIALSFWVLKITGSTVMVGTMLGMITIPRVIIGPLAGAFVDRHSRKSIIVFMDLIRGITILPIAVLAKNDMLPLWCLFLVALVDGVCTSFFNPSIEAFLPEVVSEENLVKSKSLFDMLKMGVDVLGQTLGGFIYSLIGGPMMFLLNALSYIISSGTEVFIREENKGGSRSKNNLFSDIKEGFRFIWISRGLFLLILMSFLFNFLFGMVRVLIIPWFASAGGFGEVKYGLFNGACSIGMILGMLLLTLVKVGDKYKYKAYILAVIMFVGLIHCSALINTFPVVIVGFTLAFVCMAVFNTLLATTVILNTPANMRGKVSATKLTICLAASPLGNILGGVIGEYMSARMAIVVITTIAVFVILPFSLHRDVKSYMVNSNKAID